MPIPLPTLLSSFLDAVESGAPSRAVDVFLKGSALPQLLSETVSCGNFQSLAALAPALTDSMLNPPTGSHLADAIRHAGHRDRMALKALSAAERQKRAEELAAFLARLIDLGANPSGAKTAKSQTSPLGTALYADPLISDTLLRRGAVPSPDDLRLAIHLNHPDTLEKMLPLRKMTPSLLSHLSLLARSFHRPSPAGGPDCLEIIEIFKARRERAALAKTVGGKKRAPSPAKIRI